MSVSRATKGANWCLYDKRRSTFHNGLTFQEARAITRILAPEDRMFWYAWKEGWNSWKLLSHTSELTATTTAYTKTIEPPPLPALANHTGLTPLPEFYNEEINSESPVEEELVEDEVVESEDKVQDFSRRKADRISGELAVEVICQGRKFYSVTQDVSVGGVRLKDPVPNWMAGYGTLILSRADIDQKLEFVCSIVEDQELGKKYRLEIHTSKDSVILKRWLLDMHIKNIKKNPA